MCGTRKIVHVYDQYGITSSNVVVRNLVVLVAQRDFVILYTRNDVRLYYKDDHALQVLYDELMKWICYAEWSR